MRKLFTIFIFSLPFISCVKNQSQINTSEAKSELIQKAEKVISQLNIQFDTRKIKEIKKDKTNSKSLLKALALKQTSYKTYSVESSFQITNLDTANAVSYHFLLNDGFELESVIIPYTTNTSEFYNYIVGGNEELGLDLITRIDPNTQDISIAVSGKYGGWWGCMKNFFGSDVGTFVNIMGVAGGVGCIPCAIIAGFTTGIMGIACIHG